MAKILVTGGAGYIGSVCSTELIAQGHQVIVVDDLSTGHQQAVPFDACFYRAEIGDANTLAQIVKRESIDTVFHFAAKALIPESVSNPGVFFDTNVAGSVRMLEGLRSAGITKFVFSSSAAVYGNPDSPRIREEDRTEPVNSYGATKLMLEQVLRWYASAYKWSVVAFRYFNASGSLPNLGERHNPETHILPLLLQVASGRRRCFEIFGDDYPTPDGTCLRDYVHVLDIARAHILALKQLDQPGFQVYNIGTGTSHSVREVCNLVEKVTGRKLNVRMGPRRPGDPAVLCASPEKLRRCLAWAPTHSDLTAIIASAWNWELQSNQFAFSAKPDTAAAAAEP